MMTKFGIRVYLQLYNSYYATFFCFVFVTPNYAGGSNTTKPDRDARTEKQKVEKLDQH